MISRKAWRVFLCRRHLTLGTEGVDARGRATLQPENQVVVEAARGISVSKPVEIRQHIGPYRTKQRSKSCVLSTLPASRNPTRQPKAISRS